MKFLSSHPEKSEKCRGKDRMPLGGNCWEQEELLYISDCYCMTNGIRGDIDQYKWVNLAGLLM